MKVGAAMVFGPVRAFSREVRLAIRDRGRNADRARWWPSEWGATTSGARPIG